MVGYLLTPLLQIYCRVWWQKNFENRLALRRVTAKIKWHLFSGHGVQTTNDGVDSHGLAAVNFRAVAFVQVTLSNTTGKKHQLLIKSLPVSRATYSIAAQLNSWLPSRRRSKLDEHILTNRKALDCFAVHALGSIDRMLVPNKSFVQPTNKHVMSSIPAHSTTRMLLRIVTITVLTAIGKMHHQKPRTGAADALLQSESGTSLEQSKLPDEVVSAKTINAQNRLDRECGNRNSFWSYSSPDKYNFYKYK